MRKISALTIFIALLILCVVVGIVLSPKFDPPGRWKQVTIATATEGGTYYKLGREFELILKDVLGERIGDVNAVRTPGSKHNIDLLVKGEANVAFTMKSDLVRAAHENSQTKQELRILARLYKDVMQIVVRKGAGIRALVDLKNKKIFIGPEGSGTREIAKQILKTVWLSEESYTTDDANTFAEAAKRLKEDKLDAAFFMAGTPTDAVKEALDSNDCKLLSLDPNTLRSLMEHVPKLGLEICPIPAHIYSDQLDVNTVASDVFLVCRKDLPKDLAFVIIEALFDNIEEQLFVHAKAQDIKLTEAFERPKGFEFHPGALKFKKKEEQKLLIATGALNGKYYQLGETIQYLLELRGIPCRLTHTDGSLENAKLLQERPKRPTIAIMQIDAAIACLGGPRLAYGGGVSNEGIPKVKDIVAIAGLHKEQAHVVARRHKLKEIEENLKWEQGRIKTLSDLKEAITNLRPAELKVCLGPKNSATQLVAQAILKHHKIEPNFIERLFLSVRNMVDQIHSGDIDVGFFISHVPSKAMEEILDSNEVRLLSLGKKERAEMTERVFTASTIEPNMYVCQEEGEPIETISTRAVLVTTKDLPSDVAKAITETIRKWRTSLPVELKEKEMIEGLSPLPLHRGAEQYYKDVELLPSEPPLLHRLQWMWYILGCLTMLVTVMLIPAYTGLIILRRSRAANEIGRRILGIPLEAGARDSVQRLLKIRDEIQQRVRRRWWKWGELDKHRWRYLRDLIHDRIGEAKENLTRVFVAEIRAVATDTELDETARRQRYRSIENRILEFFEKAELDPVQQKMLRELLQECKRQDTEKTISRGDKKRQ